MQGTGFPAELVSTFSLGQAIQLNQVEYPVLFKLNPNANVTGFFFFFYLKNDRLTNPVGYLLLSDEWWKK